MKVFPEVIQPVKGNNHGLIPKVPCSIATTLKTPIIAATSLRPPQIRMQLYKKTSVKDNDQTDVNRSRIPHIKPKE